MVVTGYGNYNGKDYWLVKNRYSLNNTISMWLIRDTIIVMPNAQCISVCLGVCEFLDSELLLLRSRLQFSLLSI